MSNYNVADYVLYYTHLADKSLVCVFVYFASFCMKKRLTGVHLVFSYKFNINSIHTVPFGRQNMHYLPKKKGGVDSEIKPIFSLTSFSNVLPIFDNFSKIKEFSFSKMHSN